MILHQSESKVYLFKTKSFISKIIVFFGIFSSKKSCELKDIFWQNKKVINNKTKTKIKYLILIQDYIKYLQVTFNYLW